MAYFALRVPFAGGYSFTPATLNLSERVRSGDEGCVSLRRPIIEVPLVHEHCAGRSRAWRPATSFLWVTGDVSGDEV